MASKAPDVTAKVTINGKEYNPLGSDVAKGEYDAIVLGTGLTECIIGGLLSVAKKRVLQLDRDTFYGGESASLNISQMVEKFMKKEATAKDFKLYGENYQSCIDQVPKFLMSSGNMVKILVHSKVHNYIEEFKQIRGSFVYRGSAKRPYKVPCTPKEAFNSKLMGIFQKRKLRNFLVFVQKAGATKDVNVVGKTGGDLMSYWGLDANTMSFVGHAMALCPNEDFMTSPAADLIEKINLYAYSLSSHGVSPYIYPKYGLGSLPEGFARLSAVHGEALGGAFMLGEAVDEVLFDKLGKAIGVRSGDKAAKAPIIVGQPRYFPASKKKVVGKVARAICILDHPIKYTDSPSCMIILPANQLSLGSMFGGAKYPPRKNDIYVTCVDSSFEVVAPGKYVAFVSTLMESDDPAKELQAGIDLLGPIVKQFTETSEVYVPINDTSKDNCHISASLDSSTHFQTVADDVLRLYKNITGKELDMNIKTDEVRNSTEA